MMNVNQGETVDVQKIVDSIRADIASSYSEDDLKQFEDITIAEALRDSQAMFDKNHIRAAGVSIKVEPNIDFYQKFGGGVFARLVKKVIRRLIRCVMEPINRDQNAFNRNTVEAVDQLSWAYLQQQAEIDALISECQKLREENEKLKDFVS